MKKIYLISLLSLFLIGCATTQIPSKFKMSVIESKITKGETTKTDVLKEFGEPNIITKNTQTPGVAEIWTYSKFSMNVGGNWATIFLLGGFGASSSTKSVTLMIYFDENEIVKDYSITTSQF